jgi:toxin ParE1/3/4
MARFTFSVAAERDIVSILTWTHEHFGEQARLRYEALLVQAMIDIAENPHCPGSEARDEIAGLARTYHIWHSRNRVDKVPGRVHRPRHFLIYRVNDRQQIEIGRVLHESVDLPNHLPTEYRRSPNAADDPGEGQSSVQD